MMSKKRCRTAKAVAISLGIMAAWVPQVASASPQHAGEGLLWPITIFVFGTPAICAGVVSVARAILRPQQPAHLAKTFAVAFLTWTLSMIALGMFGNLHGHSGHAETFTQPLVLALGLTLLLAGRVAFKPVDTNKVDGYE